MWRLNGRLAVSRSVGDTNYKNQMIEEASCTTIPAETIDETEYLVMGCDGIWDVIEPSELPQLISTFKETNAELAVENRNLDLAKCLVKEALKRRSGDNLSAIVVNIGEMNRSTK